MQRLLGSLVLQERQSIAPGVIVCYLAVVVLLIATFCIENLAVKVRARDGFLLIVLLFVALYFFSPADTAGGAVINQRLALFVIVSPLPWFSPRLARLAAVPLVVIFSLIAIVNAGFQLRHFRHSSGNTAQFLIAAHEIAPNSVVLPLLFTRSMRGRRGRSNRPWCMNHKVALATTS